MLYKCQFTNCISVVLQEANSDAAALQSIKTQLNKRVATIRERVSQQEANQASASALLDADGSKHWPIRLDF